MISRVQWFLIKILLKGDITMMALLLAQRIILGKLEFSAVPTSLKAAVSEILTDSGLAPLIDEG